MQGIEVECIEGRDVVIFVVAAYNYHFIERKIREKKRDIKKF